MRHLPKLLPVLAAAFLVWQIWFDTLPEDYCDTSDEFKVFNEVGILAVYFPDSDYREKEMRKICTRMYVICGGNRQCTKSQTFGYDKW